MKFRKAGKPLPVTRLTDIIHRCYFQQVRFFIDLGMKLNERDDERRTPLMLCAFMEPEIWGVGTARLLIEKGAILDRHDSYGMTALHLACIYGRADLTEVLLRALDFDLLRQDKWGNTALHYAVRSNDLRIVRLVLQTQCKYRLSIDKKNKDGLSPLDLARRLSMEKISQELELAEQSFENSGSTSFTHIPSIQIEQAHDPEPYEEAMNGCVPQRSVRVLLPSRPRTSIGLRRQSSLSSSSSSLYTASRSQTFYRGAVRKDPEPNEKDNKLILQCASLSDFRNNAEYLYHLLKPGVLPNGDMTLTFTNGRPRSCSVPKSQNSSAISEAYRKSWRGEFKKLYKHYEYQCSSSYRDSVKYVHMDYDMDNAPTPSPSEDTNEDDRGRKGKRAASASKQSEISKRKQSAQKAEDRKSTRKSSATPGSHNHKTSNDVTETSSDSMSSSTSHRKGENSGKASGDKSGSAGSENGHGRASRTAHYKGPSS